MGINGLWDIIGDEGEIIHIADFAARHFEQHKRPLRVAVDEACWRFTNLTPEQVESIRKGEPAANPVEKTILWRCLRLMKLNIQLLFVYDGLRKPWKRDKQGGSRLDKELVKLLHQLFDHLKIPYHQAPGEAEAECARLQQLGIVDIVWADDGDAFMFGCTKLIKQHKIGKERVKDYVRVYEAQSLLEKLDFDADSFMLFAMLAGGDYDVQGLEGCGPQTARLVSKKSHGIARAARFVTQARLPAWRQALEQTFRDCGKFVELPPTFPNFKALGHYRSPAVSEDAQLHDLRGLRQGWDRPIDQTKLRVILRTRFNMQTKDFLKHIAPIYLSRALARATPEQREENLQYGVELRRTRKPKKVDGCDEPPVKSEVKVSFSPLPAVEIDLGRPPADEDWSLWEGKDGTPYDPVQQSECEILMCFLRHGLPENSYDAPEVSKRKRKAAEEVSASQTSPDDTTLPSVSKRAKSSAVNAPASSEKPKSRGRPPKDPDAGTTSVKPRKRTKKAAAPAREKTPSPPPPTFRLPSAFSLPEFARLRQDEPSSLRDGASRPLPKLALPSAGLYSLHTITHGHTSDSCPQSSIDQPLLRSTLPPRDSTTQLQCDVSAAKPPATSYTKAPSSHEASTNLLDQAVAKSSPSSQAPGEVFDATALRNLRANSGLLGGLPTLTGSRGASAAVPPHKAKVPMGAEVIDLT